MFEQYVKRCVCFIYIHSHTIQLPTSWSGTRTRPWPVGEPGKPQALSTRVGPSASHGPEPADAGPGAPSPSPGTGQHTEWSLSEANPAPGRQTGRQTVYRQFPSHVRTTPGVPLNVGCCKIIIGRAGASPPSRTTGPRCLYTCICIYILSGAYEPPKAARSVQLRRTALHLRAFSAFRIRTVLDYGEYPLR